MLFCYHNPSEIQITIGLPDIIGHMSTDVRVRVWVISIITVWKKKSPASKLHLLVNPDWKYFQNITWKIATWLIPIEILWSLQTFLKGLDTEWSVFNCYPKTLVLRDSVSQSTIGSLTNFVSFTNLNTFIFATLQELCLL